MRSLLSCLAFLTCHNESNGAFLWQWLTMGKKRAVVEYRKSVDLSFEDASKALDMLPPTVFTQGTGKFYPMAKLQRIAKLRPLLLEKRVRLN